MWWCRFQSFYHRLCCSVAAHVRDDLSRSPSIQSDSKPPDYETKLVSPEWSHPKKSRVEQEEKRKEEDRKGWKNILEGSRRRQKNLLWIFICVCLAVSCRRHSLCPRSPTHSDVPYRPLSHPPLEEEELVLVSQDHRRWTVCSMRSNIPPCD